MIREKKTKSGPLLEADFYPVWSDGRRMPVRAPRKRLSTAAQEKYNHQQAVKKAVRIVSTNFSSGDIKFDPTFLPEEAPLTREAALKIHSNYIRRIKTKRVSELKRINSLLSKSPDDEVLKKKKAKLEQPFKYYGSIQETIYKSGPHKGKSNWHFHMIMTGGIDRDICEDMWPSRARLNCDRFRPEVFGPEAAAKYLARDIAGKRQILCSKNLDKPDDTVKDGTVTPRAVERMAKLRSEDREYWEKRYKGYRFVRCFPRYNEYNGHWYVSVIMYKTDADPPPWSSDKWVA